jgi:hypothetical protein
MTIFGLFALLISGLASPFIFAPSFAIGWFARRWWHLPLGAALLTILDQAEIMLIEMPDAQPDGGLMPLGVIPPLCWCVAGFALRAWSRHERRRRSNQTIRALPIIAGMVLGALSVAVSALGVALLYLHTDQFEFHAFGLERTADSSAPYEAIFFQYLFPGLLLGQLTGGLIGRVLGHPLVPPAGRPHNNPTLSA